MITMRVVVAGAGGFIGHNLVKHLKRQGYWVRGVDVKHPEYEPTTADAFEVLDLRRWNDCLQATRGVETCYNLAANMGGIGFISKVKAEVMHDSVLINTHMLEASRLNGVQRFLFTSSACVYPGYRQNLPDVVPLKEEDAYPADAEDGYGWEKLFSERMCRHYHEDHGLATYVVRLHNVYGPLGTYDGGREKAPAAICRKIALARDGDEIEVWGDGKQTRSYCYIDDCLEGMCRLIQTEEHGPVNIGSSRLVTVDQMIDIVAGVSGKRVIKRYDVTKPQGVRGRNSDNTRLRRILGWEPQTTLEDGLARTYRWIHEQLAQAGRVREDALR